jgi:hypothetical protein
MGRAVLAETDGIVGHDEDRPDLHHGRQTDRRAAVVRKAQEGAAVGDQTAVQGDAVRGGGHAVFAHAVMHVGAAVFSGLDLDHALGLGVVRGRQIGRTSQQFRNRGSKMIEYGAAGGGAGRRCLVLWPKRTLRVLWWRLLRVTQMRLWTHEGRGCSTLPGRASKSNAFSAAYANRITPVDVDQRRHSGIECIGRWFV